MGPLVFPTPSISKCYHSWCCCDNWVTFHFPQSPATWLFFFCRVEFPQLLGLLHCPPFLLLGIATAEFSLMLFGNWGQLLIATGENKSSTCCGCTTVDALLLYRKLSVQFLRRSYPVVDRIELWNRGLILRQMVSILYSYYNIERYYNKHVRGRLIICCYSGYFVHIVLTIICPCDNNRRPWFILYDWILPVSLTVGTCVTCSNI